MGYDCSLSGTLTVPAGAEPALLAAFAAHSVFGETSATLREALTEQMCLDYVEPQPAGQDGSQVLYLSYSGRLGEVIDDGLALLARGGVTGAVVFDGEDALRWKVVLADGATRELDATVFYPGDPDPDAPCAALTRRQAQALLALVAGDRTTDLTAAVAALTAGLG